MPKTKKGKAKGKPKGTKAAAKPKKKRTRALGAGIATSPWTRLD